MNKDFVWGAATASYQIEGAFNEDGKGLSIWDKFTKTEGKIFNDDNGDIACDHYHRYKEDIALMAKLGINAYRFSISWTRILPDGIGKINQKGIEFYNNLINELLKYNIKPYITLYHWDLPQALQEKGGFQNREIIDWFSEYTEIVAKNFGDRCKNFMTFNEPQCILGLGYNIGGHAPGLHLSEAETFKYAHNLLLAHGKAVEIIRRYVKGVKVGITTAGFIKYPLEGYEKLTEKAKQMTFDNTNIFSPAWIFDTIVFGKYPDVLIKKFPEVFDNISREDMNIIHQKIDFIGYNIYNGACISENKKGEIVEDYYPVGTAFTTMGWAIDENSIYYMLKFMYERYNLPIIVSENGMANIDMPSLDGKVHDSERINYMERFIKKVMQAKEEGVDVKGYFYWSFMDNFEWANGYSKRFGLVFIDYKTEKRIPKDSYFWYKNYISKI